MGDVNIYGQAAGRWRETAIGYPLPLPAGKKTPPPEGFTGYDGAVPGDPEYREWAEQRPDANVALRLSPSVVGIDVDAYEKSGKQKQGAATLKRIEATHGPLPATWTSTARSDGVSGIRLYTVDPALTDDFPSLAGPDIEIIRHAHRYAVVHPSIHPDTGGEYQMISPDGDTTRLPNISDLARLPDDWIRHLNAESNGGCRCLTTNQGFAVAGPKTSKFGTPEAAWLHAEQALHSGTSRHDSTTAAVMALHRYTEKGHPDAAGYLDELHDLYIDTVATDRGGRQVAEREWDRMNAGAAKRVAASPTPEGAGLRFTDVDNSTRLIQLHATRLRYVIEWGTWIVWDGTRWLIDRNKVAVSELAKDVSSVLYRQAAETKDHEMAKKVAGWASQSATRGRIESMTHLARGIEGVVISHDDLDADPWLLGVTNGYINLRTGRHHQPDPDKLMTMQAPVAYDPKATTPRWTQALAEWFPDPDVIGYVQRLSGHAISGDPLGDHVFAIHYGDGRNGKGTYMRAHKHVLGPYYVTPDKSLLIQKRHEQHATVKARLFRTRLAVASETEQRERLNEAQVKNLTGGDPINARRMREDEWEFEPTHSLWLQTNYPPEIHGNDTGIWSRIRIVPWTQTFNGHTDANLDTNLAAEAPGILNWLIEGCLDWQEHGLDEPETVLTATLDYRASEDILARFATDTGLAFTPGGTVVDSILKNRLASWAEDEGVDRPDAKKVNSWMKDKGCRASTRRYTKPNGKSARGKMWKGAEFDNGENPYTPTGGTGGTGVPVKQLYESRVGVNRQSGATRATPDGETVGNVDATPLPDDSEGWFDVS